MLIQADLPIHWSDIEVGFESPKECRERIHQKTRDFSKSQSQAKRSQDYEPKPVSAFRFPGMEVLRVNVKGRKMTHFGVDSLAWVLMKV